MTELEQAVRNKGYFLNTIHHTKGKYTQKITYTITNLLGEVVYNKTLRYCPNTEDSVFIALDKLPVNNFKTLDIDENLNSILGLFYNYDDDEPEDEPENDNTIIDINNVDIWDLFESEAI